MILQSMKMKIKILKYKNIIFNNYILFTLKVFFFFQNNFEEDPKPVVENNFISKNDKNKIPSLLEMQIPVPMELKSTDQNPDEDSGNQKLLFIEKCLYIIVNN